MKYDYLGGADVVRLTMSRYLSLLVDILVHSCSLPPTADLTWSFQRMADLPRGLVPSARPCTTKCSMESVSRLGMSPKNLMMGVCTKSNKAAA